MSVFDVVVHNTKVRAAKIRLDKLQESDNDAVTSVCLTIFFHPYNDASPQDNATHEVQEKDESQFEEGTQTPPKQCIATQERRPVICVAPT